MGRLNWKRHAKTALCTLPALVGAIAFQFSPPFSDMLFEGGRAVFINNVCQIVLLPYFVLFILALGTSLLPAKPFNTHYITSTDIELFRFFGGAGILIVLGVILGMVKLLVPWVTIPIFLLVLYLYFFLKQISRSSNITR